MNFLIRDYSPSDFRQLTEVYVSAFAEPPWDEYRKCTSCGINYGIAESVNPPALCKKCTNPLSLAEFWSRDGIKADLDFALDQKDSIALVAVANGKQERLLGTTWGYRLPFGKFPFLKGSVSPNSSYLDDIAVRGDSRRLGVGVQLGERFVQAAQKVGVSEVVLRTDKRNASSMGLFVKLGFTNTGITDPEFEWRIYLKREL